MKQISFAQAEHQNNKKVTRREVFPTRLIFLIQFSDSGIVGRLFDQAPHEVTKNHKKAWAYAQAIDQNSFSAMLLTHPRNYTGQPRSGMVGTCGEGPIAHFRILLAAGIVLQLPGDAGD